MLEDKWMRYVENNPMMVDEMTDWVVNLHCKGCDMPLPKKGVFLYKKEYISTIEADDRAHAHTCPHCFQPCHRLTQFTYLALPIYKMKSRTIFLEPQEYRFCFFKKNRKSFTQYVKLD